MTDLDPKAFQAFAAEALPLVRPPGPDAARRSAARRAHARTAVTAAALSGVVTAGGFALHDSTSPPDGQPGLAPSPSASRQSSVSPTPHVGLVYPSHPVTPAAKPAGPTVPSDFATTGPPSVKLVPEGERYKGSVIITVRNNGRHSNQGVSYRVHLPPGVELDFSKRGSLSACMYLGGPEAMNCVGPGPIPVGGGANVKVDLVANYAPGNNQTITGFEIEAVPEYPNQAAAEQTPGDNTLKLDVVLAPS